MPNGHIDACPHLTTGICTCKKESDRYQRLSLLSFSLFLIETAGALFTGSLALLSDAFHTLFDGAENILSAFIAHKARFTGNEVRLRRIGGTISAILIFVISWFILDEAFDRLDSSDHLVTGWAVPFAFVALGINWFQLKVHEEAPDEHRNVTHTWQRLHIVTDIGASVAALFGTVLASVGIPLADTFISIGIVIVIWVRITKYFLDILFEKPDIPGNGHHH
jgi:cobalt-zinc-cadmium efflux system protein